MEHVVNTLKVGMLILFEDLSLHLLHFGGRLILLISADVLKLTKT